MFLYIEADMFVARIYLLNRDPREILSEDPAGEGGKEQRIFFLKPEPSDVIAKLSLENSGELLLLSEPPTKEERSLKDFLTAAKKGEKVWPGRLATLLPLERLRIGDIDVIRYVAYLVEGELPALT